MAGAQNSPSTGSLVAAKKVSKGTPAKAKNPTVDSEAFQMVSDFKGYRSKEDMTILPPGYLVPGSQNVLTTTDGQITIRPGYTLDGQADSSNAGIKSSFDWKMHIGTEQHLKSGNGLLQFRYVSVGSTSWNGNSFTDGQVYWITLVSGLTAAEESINYTVFWDSTNLQQKLLYVNSDSSIYEWSGGVAILASATINTLTLQGTKTWAQLGFLNAGTRTININGVTATYSGGEGTATLTGVSVDFSATAAGAVVFQAVRTNANSASTGLPSVFENDLIGILKNQIYVGSFKDNSVYISKQNSLTDFSYTSPVRVVGEGAIVTLDDTPIAFQPQEDTMYISAGKNYWYQISFTLSSDLTKESLNIKPLKSSGLEAVQSQALITKVKNSVLFVSGEPTLSDLGRVSDNLATPQSVNISDPIKPEFSGYDFTNASAFYDATHFWILIALPAKGITLIYNLATSWWEAPQILPFSRYSIINGQLYGHSGITPETYKVFDFVSTIRVYSDNSNPIHAVAAVSYMNFGKRGKKKYFNELYSEGYISSNTALTHGIKYDFGGFRGIVSKTLQGTDATAIFYTTTDGSLGKNPLGGQPLGSITDSPLNTPKFRKVFTFSDKDFYETQIFFESNDVDQNWQLLSFGVNALESSNLNNEIKS